MTRRRHIARRPRPGDDVVCQQLVELVTDYLEGALDADLRARLEVHLAGCGHCAGYVTQTRRILELTRSGSPAVPPAMLAALTEEFRRRTAS